MNNNIENNTSAPKKAKKPNKIMSFLKSRNAKRGSISILLTVLFIAVVVGLNIVATLLTNRFPVLSSDLTSNSVYKLTQTSVEYVKNLKDDVNVYVLMEEKALESQGEYYIQVNKLLEAFDQQSDHITLKYINLATNPTFTSDYPDINWQTTGYLMLVEHGDSYIAVKYEDVFEYDQEAYQSYGEYVISSQKLEQALLTAVLNVTTEEKVLVTMLEGHGELDPAPLASLLSNNAYEIETVSLLNGKISEESQFVVLFAPTNDIDKDTYDTLVDWLYNDGDYGHTLLYVPNDLVTTETPYIDTLLQEWGMEVQKGWIYETDSTHMTNSMYPNLISIYSYEESDFSGGLRDTSIPVVMMYCMPVEIIDSVATPLLASSESAVVMPLDADEDWDAKNEQEQKLVGAAIASQGNEDNSSSSNILVFGSYTAFSESALKATSFNNSAYFINMFNTIAQRDDVAITIEGKSLDSAELGITSSATSAIIAVFFRYIVPLAVVTVGVVMWLLRRHK